MIIRTVDGKLIIVNRSQFTNDLTYYQKIYELMYLYTHQYNAFVSIS